MVVSFEEWTQGRTIQSMGTNFGAPELPFQKWRHFKESFAPELIDRAITESHIPVHRCLDPFGGSGTTALACQFLGVHPVTIEINPFLADLIEAKLAQYNPDALVRDLGTVLRRLEHQEVNVDATFQYGPSTFVEPGVNNRWVFDREVAFRIVALRTAVEELATEQHRQLFRVLLGGILVEVSNVVVNGKGRRYRKGWIDRRHDPKEVDTLFCESVRQAIVEIHRFSRRACPTYDLLRGDSRTMLPIDNPCDLAVFSPPYPNSFDYTDVYNLELWALGYLNGRQDNQTLRGSSLCSHVQVMRNYLPPPSASPTLTGVLEQLSAVRASLWNRWIPEMVGGYFTDIVTVLSNLYHSLTPGGSAWLVVGDSRYADIHIETVRIIEELINSSNWKVEKVEPFRSMRASPQQGGRQELTESLIILTTA